MSTTEAALSVPDEAVEKLKCIASFGAYEAGEEFSAQPEVDVRAIAAPVVAAWARSRAAEYDGMGTGAAARVFSDVAADLRGWADQLDSTS